MAVEITPEYLARNNTEDGHQAALFMLATDPRYTDWLGVNAPLWSLLYAIPNGGKRSAATAARLKATGVKKGFPDIGLPVARRYVNGLYIELKRIKTTEKRKGTVAADQNKWHDMLREQGYMVNICYGWQHAFITVRWYLAENG